MASWQLTVGECVLVMVEQIEDNSIPLTITSPPYDDLRAYHGYSFDFPAIAAQLWRVTRPGGVVVWIVRDQVARFTESCTSFEQALFFRSLGFLVNTMIYAVRNPKPNPQRVSYTPQFEFMFVLSKGKPAVTNWLMEPSKYAGSSTNGSNGRAQGYIPAKNRTIQRHKRRGNIWWYTVGSRLRGNDRASGGHPAPFPPGLARDHILAWSNPGDTVLDPMCGRGTVGEEALPLGRHFIGIDVSAVYVAEAERNLQGAKPHEQM